MDNLLSPCRVSDNLLGEDREQPSISGLGRQVMLDHHNIYYKCKNVNKAQTIKDNLSIYNVKKLDDFPSTSDVFVGRTDEMKDILKKIKEEQIVIIKGIGGSGKTRLAIECALKWVNEEEFVRAIFMSSETDKLTNDTFKSIEEKLPIKFRTNGTIENVYKFFNDKKTLFVLDNVEQTINIESFLPPEDIKNVCILATTQCSEYETLFSECILTPLKESEAEKLIKNIFEKIKRRLEKFGNSKSKFLLVREQDAALIKKLIITLEFHPLALQHAAATIMDDALYVTEDHFSVCVDNYLKHLGAKIKAKFPNEFKVQYSETVFNSLRINIEKSIEEPYIRKILFTMCFMNPVEITFGYFRKYGGFEDDEIKLAKRTLRKYSIIQMKTGCAPSEAEDFPLYIHRLVIEVCLELMKEKIIEFENVIKSVLNTFLECSLEDHNSVVNQHSHFLLRRISKHNLINKMNLCRLYVDVFKENSKMNTYLNDRLQLIDLTVDDISEWTATYFCIFIGHLVLFDYFQNEHQPESNIDWLLIHFLRVGRLLLKCEDNMLVMNGFKGLTILHLYAACGTSLDEFKKFIKRYKNLNMGDKRNNSPLLYAIKNKRYDFGYELIKKGAECINKDLALMCAVVMQDFERTQELIRSGANVNFVDDEGFCPIFYTIFTANPDIFDLLLKNNARIEWTSKMQNYRKTILLLVLEPGIDHWMNTDNKFSNKDTMLRILPDIRQEDRQKERIQETVEFLVKHNASTDIIDNEGRTPLMISIEKELEDVALLLVEASVNNTNFNFNQADKNGRTALMLAIEKGLENVALKLTESRATANISEDEKRNLIIAAIRNRFEDVAIKIIETGIDVNQINNEGDTLLILALKARLDKVTVKLLEVGFVFSSQEKMQYGFEITRLRFFVISLLNVEATYNQSDEVKRNLLIAAIKNKFDDVAIKIIRSGIDVNQTSNEGDTLLILALKAGLDKVAMELLEAGADFIKRDNQEQMPLMLAMEARLRSVVMFLIEAEVIDNESDDVKRNLLFAAIRNQFDYIAIKIIESEIDVNQTNNEDDTLLILALKAKLDKVAMKLLEAGADFSKRGNQEKSPLMLAIKERLESVVLFLLEAGAIDYESDEEKRNLVTKVIENDLEYILVKIHGRGIYINNLDTGSTPFLMLALNRHSKKVAMKLIQMGVDIHAGDSILGISPLMLAIRTRLENVAMLLIDKQVDINQSNLAGETPLTIAIEEHLETIIVRLLNMGANINHVINYNDETPMTLAIKTRCTNCVSKLLDTGKINYTGDDGWKLLRSAIIENETSVLKKLMNIKIDVNFEDSFGNTPLLYAIVKNREAIALILIENGADINKINKNGTTPLSKAILAKYSNIAIRLIEMGADVNHANRLGQTPLLCSVAQNLFPVVSKLLNVGVDVNKADKNGRTALIYAIDSKRWLPSVTEEDILSVVKLLIDHKANINASDNKKKTALMYANKNNFNDVVRVLTSEFQPPLD